MRAKEFARFTRAWIILKSIYALREKRGSAGCARAKEEEEEEEEHETRNNDAGVVRKRNRE